MKTTYKPKVPFAIKEIRPRGASPNISAWAIMCDNVADMECIVEDVNKFCTFHALDGSVELVEVKWKLGWDYCEFLNDIIDPTDYKELALSDLREMDYPNVDDEDSITEVSYTKDTTKYHIAVYMSVDGFYLIGDAFYAKPYYDLETCIETLESELDYVNGREDEARALFDSGEFLKLEQLGEEIDNSDLCEASHNMYLWTEIETAM